MSTGGGGALERNPNASGGRNGRRGSSSNSGSVRGDWRFAASSSRRKPDAASGRGAAAPAPAGVQRYSWATERPSSQGDQNAPRTPERGHRRSSSGGSSRSRGSTDDDDMGSRSPASINAILNSRVGAMRRGSAYVDEYAQRVIVGSRRRPAPGIEATESLDTWRAAWGGAGGHDDMAGPPTRPARAAARNSNLGAVIADDDGEVSGDSEAEHQHAAAAAAGNNTSLDTWREAWGASRDSGGQDGHMAGRPSPRKSSPQPTEGRGDTSLDTWRAAWGASKDSSQDDMAAGPSRTPLARRRQQQQQQQQQAGHGHGGTSLDTWRAAWGASKDSGQDDMAGTPASRTSQRQPGGGGGTSLDTWRAAWGASEDNQRQQDDEDSEAEYAAAAAAAAAAGGGALDTWRAAWTASNDEDHDDMHLPSRDAAGHKPRLGAVLGIGDDDDYDSEDEAVYQVNPYWNGPPVPGTQRPVAGDAFPGGSGAVGWGGYAGGSQDDMACPSVAAVNAAQNSRVGATSAAAAAGGGTRASARADVGDSYSEGEGLDSRSRVAGRGRQRQRQRQRPTGRSTLSGMRDAWGTSVGSSQDDLSCSLAAANAVLNARVGAVYSGGGDEAFPVAAPAGMRKESSGSNPGSDECFAEASRPPKTSPPPPARRRPARGVSTPARRSKSEHRAARGGSGGVGHGEGAAAAAAAAAARGGVGVGVGGGSIGIGGDGGRDGGRDVGGEGGGGRVAVGTAGARVSGLAGAKVDGLAKYRPFVRSTAISSVGRVGSFRDVCRSSPGVSSGGGDEGGGYGRAVAATGAQVEAGRVGASGGVSSGSGGPGAGGAGDGRAVGDANTQGGAGRVGGSRGGGFDGGGRGGDGRATAATTAASTQDDFGRAAGGSRDMPSRSRGGEAGTAVEQRGRPEIRGRTTGGSGAGGGDRPAQGAAAATPSPVGRQWSSDQSNVFDSSGSDSSIDAGLRGVQVLDPEHLQERRYDPAEVQASLGRLPPVVLAAQGAQGAGAGAAVKRGSAKKQPPVDQEFLVSGRLPAW